MYFGHSAALSGLALWSRPSAEDVEAIFDALTAEDRLGPHSFLLDTSQLSDGPPDTAAFDRAMELFARRWPLWAPRLRRVGVVLRHGMQGTLVAGAWNLHGAGTEVRLGESLPEMLAWLDGEAAETTLLADLAEQRRAAERSGALLASLRQLLERKPAGRSLGQAARVLGMSPRSLQRRLAAERTTFKAELSAARMRVAQVLLERRDLKLAAVAHQVGFASSQHFSAAFRRATGKAPREWRVALSEARPGKGR